MQTGKTLYKIVREEKISYTSYVFASNKKQAKDKVFSGVAHERSNQDLEQVILSIESVQKTNYPVGLLITE